MAAPVADLVRSAQSKTGPLALTAPAPKSTRRFDDVLATRREQAKPQPKVEAKPHEHEASDTKAVKAARRGKADADKADPHTIDDAHANEPEPTDTEAMHEEQASESTKAAKPAAKKSATAKKPAEDADAEATDEMAEPVAQAKPQEQVDALPVEVDLVIDAKPEQADEDADKPAPTAQASVDPSAVTAQLNAMPAAVADQATATETPTDATTKVADVATAPVASAAKPAAYTESAAPSLGEPATAVDDKPRPTLENQTEEAPIDTDETAAIALPAEWVKTDTKSAATDAVDSAAAALQAITPHEKPAAHSAMPGVAQTTPDAAAKTVAENNVDHIVSSVRGELLTKGGTMEIRLDPPSLGAINVQISVDDGVMTASLQTTNDEATRLLSHNLSQLKTQLESTGVTIDHISVKQAAPSEQSSASSQQGDSGERQSSRETGQEQSARQEQQRREMLARMWAKLSGNGDPLDLVA